MYQDLGRLVLFVMGFKNVSIVRVSEFDLYNLNECVVIIHNTDSKF